MRKILIIGGYSTTDENRKIVFQSIIEIAKANSVDVYSPFDTKKVICTDNELYERAIKLVKEADLIIAECSHPSTGMGMELQEAFRIEKPVIVTVKNDASLSRLIKGHVDDNHILRYKNIHDLKLLLEKELSKIIISNKNN